MQPTLAQALKKNFLGNSPDWYEKSIIAFLDTKPADINGLWPVYYRLGIDREVYLHPGDGAKMLPAAARRPTRY